MLKLRARLIRLRIRGFWILLVSLLLAQSVSWSQQGRAVDQASLTSLKLRILNGDREIGTATGFVVEKHDKHYLITNRHVVLACGPDTDAANIGGWMCANRLAILHNKVGHLTESLWVTEELYDPQRTNRLWIEHPTLRGSVDIVALPLLQTQGIQFYPLDLVAEINEDVSVLPGDSITIVGFPFGIVQSGGLPIWKAGTIASDPDMDYSGKRMFAVDTTSRPGMSGSPVYAVRSVAYRNKSGQLMSPAAAGRSVKRFLGIYSEQQIAAEIGGVWKAEVVKELYDSLP
jgi:Trypsin-like peptidase domain